MTEELAILAARNNAEWCAAVCSAYGVPGAWFSDLWVTAQRTPMFYPNAVTLTDGDAATQTERVRALLKSETLTDIGVKDSFCTLDLAPLGFVTWLEAEWIYRNAALPAPDMSIAGVVWRKIDTERDLVDWEAAWNVGNNDPVHVFMPSLLADKNIAFFGAYCDQRIVAGGIANRSGEVVGISNIFTPEGAAQDFWASFTGVVTEAFAGCALVGYEGGGELEIAQKLGFQAIGALRVWGIHME